MPVCAFLSRSISQISKNESLRFCYIPLLHSTMKIKRNLIYSCRSKRKISTFVHSIIACTFVCEFCLMAIKKYLNFNLENHVNIDDDHITVDDYRADCFALHTIAPRQSQCYKTVNRLHAAKQREEKVSHSPSLFIYVYGTRKLMGGH